jgi:hypothetical protein
MTTKLVKLQANLYQEKLDSTNKHEVVFCSLLVSRKGESVCSASQILFVFEINLQWFLVNHVEPISRVGFRVLH